MVHSPRNQSKFKFRCLCCCANKSITCSVHPALPDAAGKNSTVSASCAHINMTASII